MFHPKAGKYLLRAQCARYATHLAIVMQMKENPTRCGDSQHPNEIAAANTCLALLFTEPLASAYQHPFKILRARIKTHKLGFTYYRYPTIQAVILARVYQMTKSWLYLLRDKMPCTVCFENYFREFP